MYAVGLKLKEMFDKVCAETADFSGSDFTWMKGNPSDTDVVLYIYYKKRDGIIQNKGAQAVHESASGGTYPHASGMISEIYMEPMDGAANLPAVVANLIFHELMHNKLDSSAPQTVADIHTGGGGGLAAAVVSRSSVLTPTNITLMAKGLSKKVIQYTTKMKDSAS
jgi:hypothetical protein